MTGEYKPVHVRAGAPPSFAPVRRSRLLQRRCACGGTPSPNDECVECSKKRLGLQRRSAGRSESSVVPPLVDKVLRSPGQPLDPDTRAFMEPRFGHDFGHVRVHSDEKAAESARAVGALAYTVGQNIVFGAGRYAPGTDEGRKLLAHELTHVAQQRATPPPGSSELSLGHPEAASEREADAVSRAVVSGRVAPPISSSSPAGQLQRQSLPAKFPKEGIRVIGPDAQALVGILSACTGILLTLDADGMLIALQGPVASAKVSPTARDELSRFLETRPGIIVDTNPAAEATIVGTFSKEAPGYQQIDVGNIQTMAAASGEKAGLGACDAVMHEISEAVAGRKASVESGVTGQRAFELGHAEGVRVEEAIRKEFGLPLRSRTERGDTVMMGKESDTVLVFLESSIFGSGKKTFTQLNVLRFTLTSIKKKPDGTTEVSGEHQVVASHVVKGLVRFGTQKEALEVFNRYASKFGLKPIAIPKEIK